MSGLSACPYATPNDDDLTGVVTHLAELTTRRGPEPRDPNEPEVRWLLEAGIRALGEAVLDREANHDSHVAYTNANGLFDTLPVERVMESFRDMCREQDLDPGSANKARLIRRWTFAANYQLDLAAYLFRPAVHTTRLTESHARLLQAIPELTFGELITRIATEETERSPIGHLYRLQNVMRLMFPRDETIRGYVARNYEVQLALWAASYAAIGTAYQLPIDLHEDSLIDLSKVLGLVIEGAVLRATGYPDNATCVDGTLAAVVALRSILCALTGVSWDELAGRTAQVAIPERSDNTITAFS